MVVLEIATILLIYTKILTKLLLKCIVLAVQTAPVFLFQTVHRYLCEFVVAVIFFVLLPLDNGILRLLLLLRRLYTIEWLALVPVVKRRRMSLFLK